MPRLPLLRFLLLLLLESEDQTRYRATSPSVKTKRNSAVESQQQVTSLDIRIFKDQLFSRLEIANNNELIIFLLHTYWSISTSAILPLGQAPLLVVAIYSI